MYLVNTKLHRLFVSTVRFYKTDLCGEIAVDENRF